MSQNNMRTGNHFSSAPPSYESIFDPNPELSRAVDWYDNASDADGQADDAYDTNGLSRWHSEPVGRDLLTLPHDVVAQIFVHACQPVVDTHPEACKPRWKRTFYPLWLGKISRSWREWAWASSELWTTIVLRINPEKIDIQTNLLREWFERAKGQLLDIYIEESPLPNLRPIPPSLHTIHPRIGLLDLISQHSEQFQRIDLHIPFWFYQYFRGSLSTRPASGGPAFPSLRCASLKVQERKGPPEPFELGFKEAPLLCTLSLFSFYMKPNILSFCPTKQITCLILNSCHNFTFKNLFDAFPRIKELTLTKCEFSHSLILPNSNPIPHDHLQILKIEFNVQVSFNRFFNLLSLPALKSLSIRVAKPLRSIDTQYIPPFLAQSGSTLTQLTLECLLTAELEYELIEFLSSDATTHLKELHIREHSTYEDQSGLAGAGLSRTFFDVLHPDLDPYYLPHLEVFEYEGLLAVQAIDFIEPLIVRSRTRSSSDFPPHAEVGDSFAAIEGVATLRKVTIKADQDSGVAFFSIAEYTDPHFVWEVIRMMEEGILRLVNMDGTVWS